MPTFKSWKRLRAPSKRSHAMATVLLLPLLSLTRAAPTGVPWESGLHKIGEGASSMSPFGLPTHAMPEKVPSLPSKEKEGHYDISGLFGRPGPSQGTEVQVVHSPAVSHRGPLDTAAPARPHPKGYSLIPEEIDPKTGKPYKLNLVIHEGLQKGKKLKYLHRAEPRLGVLKPISDGAVLHIATQWEKEVTKFSGKSRFQSTRPVWQATSKDPIKHRAAKADREKVRLPEHLRLTAKPGHWESLTLEEQAEAYLDWRHYRRTRAGFKAVPVKGKPAVARVAESGRKVVMSLRRQILNTSKRRKQKSEASKGATESPSGTLGPSSTGPSGSGSSHPPSSWRRRNDRE